MHCRPRGCRTTKPLLNDQKKDVATVQRMESDRCRPKLVFPIRPAADWGRYRKLLWRIQGPGCSNGKGVMEMCKVRHNPMRNNCWVAGGLRGGQPGRAGAVERQR